MEHIASKSPFIDIYGQVTRVNLPYTLCLETLETLWGTQFYKYFSWSSICPMQIFSTKELRK